MWRFPVWKRTDRDVRRLDHPLRARRSSLLWIVGDLRRPAEPGRSRSTDAQIRAEPAVIARRRLRDRRPRPTGDLHARRPGQPGARRPACSDGDLITAVNGTAGQQLRRPADAVRAQRRRAAATDRPTSATARPATADGQPGHASSARRSTTRRRRPSRRRRARRRPASPARPSRVTYGPVDGVGASRRATPAARSSTAPFDALQAHPGEDPGAVGRDHRRRARPEHPDQRGRRQPARRRGGRERRLGGLLPALRLAELLHRRLQPAAAAAAGRRPHRDRLVRAGPLLARTPARPARPGPGRLPTS